MNSIQAEITADLTMPEPDFRALCSELVEKLDELNCRYNVPNQSAMIERALAALAREDCQPIRSKALLAAEGEAQKLAERLHELVSILESLQIPTWPGRVRRAAELLAQQQAPAPVPARLRRCPTHGQQGAEAWGCPECVREMRNELVEAREALRRLRRWGGLANDSGFDGKVLLSVVVWIDRGAKGPLPPLPAYLSQSQP